MFLKSLKQKLDYHYRYFDRSQISPDPLEFLHRYSEPNDIEIAGIISAVFAYGNVKQIINTLDKIHGVMLNKPYDFVINYSLERGTTLFQNIKHRFFTSEDIAKFFNALNKSYKLHGSLKNMFFTIFSDKNGNFKEAVSSFSNRLTEYTVNGGNKSLGITFMFPDPFIGSACKRMNLFLRWMIRKDELDFGLWNEIPTSKLIIPVDTHIAKICEQLKLTKRKNVSWKMAEEITENLKKYDPIDPVKYDFAICHIGMRKLKF